MSELSPAEPVTTPINWSLLDSLAAKPHPDLNVEPKLPASVREVMQTARTALHLLDLVGIPRAGAAAAKVDARVYLAVRVVNDLRERLGRIKSWHARETGPAGTVGDFCNECGTRWPCDTRRLADGTYVDSEEVADA